VRALETTRPGDVQLRHQALLELGTARRWAEDIAGADDALVEAGRVAEAAGDRLAMARAAARFNHPSLWTPRDYGASAPEVIAVLERASTQCPTESPGSGRTCWVR
jgi:hypothetical protein